MGGLFVLVRTDILFFQKIPDFLEQGLLQRGIAGNGQLLLFGQIPVFWRRKAGN